jgi:hypothetical protein
MYEIRMPKKEKVYYNSIPNKLKNIMHWRKNLLKESSNTSNLTLNWTTKLNNLPKATPSTTPSPQKTNSTNCPSKSWRPSKRQLV